MIWRILLALGGLTFLGGGLNILSAPELSIGRLWRHASPGDLYVRRRGGGRRFPVRRRWRIDDRWRGNDHVRDLAVIHPRARTAAKRPGARGRFRPVDWYSGDEQAAEVGPAGPDAEARCPWTRRAARTSIRRPPCPTRIDPVSKELTVRDLADTELLRSPSAAASGIQQLARCTSMVGSTPCISTHRVGRSSRSCLGCGLLTADDRRRIPSRSNATIQASTASGTDRTPTPAQVGSVAPSADTTDTDPSSDAPAIRRRLNSLLHLLESGDLTDAEYEQKRRQILDAI